VHAFLRSTSDIPKTAPQPGTSTSSMTGPTSTRRRHWVSRRSPASPATHDRLPPVLWARLYADLEPYLNARSADGRLLLLGFYHRQLSRAARERYLAGDAERRVHQRLAAYFGEQPLDLQGPVENTPNLRMLAELPYQQTLGGCWDELYAKLTDFDFLERKVAAVDIEESTDEDGRIIRTHGGVY